VQGTLLNQFSMDEHEGNLRVATTSAPWFGGDVAAGPVSESFVTVLSQRGEELVEIGKVGGLGKDERIYSVRFIGDLGYVVTFRQVDPLYVLDLSNPEAPAVRGELKILGYSAYLHPMADGLLLGVGQDASEEGRVQGTQLAVFDVSDPANPRRVHQLRIDQSSSEAEYDHHAFLYWPQTGLTVLPLQTYTDTSFWSGAIAFEVDVAGGITEQGRLTHMQGQDDYLGQIRRSVVVGDSLYTLSDKGLMASDLATLTEQAFVEFPGFEG
ncbi:MAG: beta-propeller domain-containing protein, partial [Actinomycetota bacterium]